MHRRFAPSCSANRKPERWAGSLVADTCLLKRSRHPESGEQLLAGFDLLHRMPVELVRVDLTATVHLAEDSGLTVYDASYLWLARQLEAELVTLDRRLRAASVR